MDFEKLAKQVEKLDKYSGKFGGKAPDAQSMKNFAETLRDILMDFLKDRKEPVRPGHLYRDAAAKGILAGENADRGDNLLIKWAGRVTPNDPKAIADDAKHFADLAKVIVPVLKTYKKKDK